MGFILNRLYSRGSSRIARVQCQFLITKKPALIAGFLSEAQTL
ncbi:hypothetical protein M917_0284 [Psychrobacter aquaticus CMS 56]|uniref:Uncharacterized protein n=1 Tax=Psychrobacter aquaticus CMS 56 TaxID=1354303 RepID=U4TD58_9GAMM|nr:hypothetical protein M917_0284 [Psychrobacter aquaticus CMS 56]